jgi:PAS domain S-box-containing protein
MPEFQDYRRLFEESPTPMFVYRAADFRFLAVNESALIQYGYPRNKFLELTALDIRPESEVEAFLQASVSVPGEYRFAGKFLHRRSNGSIFWVQVFTRRTIFMREDAVLVLAIDVDQQVHMENELKEQQVKTEKILESITDGFFTLDEAWRFLYVNRETERVTGRTRSELIGRNVWEMFPGGKNSRFFAEYKKVIKEQSSAHFEAFFEELSVWVQVNAYPAGEGIAVYFRDVTQSKNTEEQVFNERQNLMAIINNTRDIIWSVDRENRIISANLAFWHRVAGIVGKPIAELSAADYNLESYAAWIPYFQTALQGETFTIIREEQREGKAIYEEVSFNPIYDRDGAVSGVSCFLRDVTAQRNHLKKIENQNAQLKQIAWVQSHRIRNHVANILGLTSILNTGSAENNPQLIEDLKLSAMRLDAVIKEISALSTDNPGVDEIETDTSKATRKRD